VQCVKQIKKVKTKLKNFNQTRRFQMKQTRRIQMKRVTFRSLMIVCLVWIFVFGLNAKSKSDDMVVIEGYIDYAGAKTWYQIVGADKKGIPLILIHGGPAACHFYLETLGALGNERPVIFYDQQGCGYSDPLVDNTYWTIEFFVGELQALIQQLQLDKYHILGQSFGAMVAADLVLYTQPKGLVSLIFAGPCLSTPLWVEDSRILLATLPEDVQEVIYWHEENGIYDTPEYEAAMMVFYQNFLCRMDPWPEPLWQTLEYLNPDIYHYMWGPSEFTVTGNLKDYDVTPDLHKIEIPSLITCGKYDECRPETAKYYQSLMPNAKLKIFNKGGHECHLEQPEQYNRTISKFLSKVERKGMKDKDKE
jgi:proline iminopeptidase